MKSDQTSTAIMNLSEILKYVTYEGNQNLVSLSSEVKQIENFIELQYLKDDDHSNISVEIDLEENDFQIAPLLLIPFIENSFKHSNHEDKDKGWIKIKIFLKDDVLDLICSNSIAHESIKKDSTGGVGMENVKKRLSLLYPEKHEILIEEKEKVYSVELKVKLSE
jgi:LytS/YehU family sensor histidine kinase